MPGRSIAVWAALQRVPSWPTMFSDIKTMKVKRQEGSAWRLEMSTQTFDGGSHDYVVLFQGERSVSIRISAPGVDAVAYVRVRPGPKPEQSFIHYANTSEAVTRTRALLAHRLR